MIAFTSAVSRIFGRPSEAAGARAFVSEHRPLSTEVEIRPDDPLIPYLESTGSVTDVRQLELSSPALDALRAAGVSLIVPLVSQGELIGMLHLGPRLSEQPYSGEDRRLLESLASHVAPAMRVGQLVREQEAEARTRERFEQELRVAQVIQQNFLPQEPPDLPGWRLSAYYQPASEVGGDFYDFIPLPDGRLGIVIGDVTDKGIPAALVMAATRSLLRAAAQRLSEPGVVLARANELLCPDIPERMFATCLFAVLDPDTGRLRYANAGHNLSYLRTASDVIELDARGMPLGLLPGMEYEEREVVVEPGASVLFHSDGLAEAHNTAGEMFGFPRLMQSVARLRSGEDAIRSLLSDLEGFVGTHHDPEDDITLVMLAREPAESQMPPEEVPELLAEFAVPSAAGNERIAVDRVTSALAEQALPRPAIERVGTAVGEATMNAMEHGNGYDPDRPVLLRVESTPNEWRISVTDHGGYRATAETAEAPDLDAKLAGEQPPRGWGLFLIEHMVDELRTTAEGGMHTVTLVFHRRRDEGGEESEL